MLEGANRLGSPAVRFRLNPWVSVRECAWWFLIGFMRAHSCFFLSPADQVFPASLLTFRARSGRTQQNLLACLLRRYEIDTAEGLEMLAFSFVHVLYSGLMALGCLDSTAERDVCAATYS